MHKHILVPIKEALGEHWIYWCRECGLICEKFGTKIYEMVPSWAENRLLKDDRSTEQYKFLVVKPVAKQSNRLGRGLNDIQTITPRCEFLAGTQKKAADYGNKKGGD